MTCHIRIQHLGIWYEAIGDDDSIRNFWREDGEPIQLTLSQHEELTSWITAAITERLAEIAAMPVGQHQAAMHAATFPVWRRFECEPAPKPQRAQPVPEFTGRIKVAQWTVPGGALEAEEARQQRDDQVQAMRHALTGRRSGKTDMLRQLAGGSFLGPCECGRPIYGTDMDRGRKCEVCRECTPPKSPTLRECVGHEYMVGLDMCRFCGVERRGATFPMSRPPTLREWLGDRVYELGPWAEVLREQPVPAGHIEELLLNSSTGWLDYIARGEHGDERGSLTRDAAIAATNPDDPFYEALQMALFTRHPAVKPEPRPAAIVCEDQYEVMP